MEQSRHQRYWQRYLLPGERAIHAFGVSGLHVAIFWITPMFLLLALALIVSLANVLLGLMMLILMVAFLVPIFYLLFFVHYAITDRRLMGREGILHKRFVTVDMHSITDVLVHERFLQRLITKTGTIGINTAGSPGVELWFRHIRRPFNLRRDIFKHLQKSAEHHQRPHIARSKN